MTTKQFYEMQLACNLTMSELLVINDALLKAKSFYQKEGRPALVGTLGNLYQKLTDIQSHYEHLCK